MTTYDAGEFTLEKVREYVWEIPQEGDMRVPARVLASEDLLDEISDDRSLKQLQQTAHLPGIQEYALAMPDAHQGYGFPVGGVAGIDAENGVISPGAVGYDINCLPGSTDVRLSFGRRIQLEDLRERFEDERAIVAGNELTDSPIRLFTESGTKPVYRVETTEGRSIEATDDHPFLTPDGMVELGDLESGDETIVQPFRGLEHEEPEAFTILTEDDFADTNPQLTRVLKDRDLLPLRSTDEELNHLLKIIGFHLGDGSLGGEGQLWFYGEPEDLESIREDVRAIGFKPSKVYSRDRQHEIDGSSFEATEHSFKTTSKALRRLLIELGLPNGSKISSGFSTPWYLDRLTDWQRALFYSAFFGAEMNAPTAQHDKNLYCPKVSQNRTVETAEAGRAFFEDMAAFLADVGIETNEIESFETDSNRDHDTIRLRLGIKNDSKNLIRFFSTVGYRYNLDKQRRAIKAIEYLERKEREIERRERTASEVRARADGGGPVRELKDEYDINDRFIERSVWSGREGRPRPGERFPDFEDFVEDFEVRENLTVTTTIESIEHAGEKPVYDIGVEHDAHNFLADGFVVSNCGVRMLKTNLTYSDVQGREEALVDALFEAIPTGLGGGGVVQTDVDTLEAVLERGVDWALQEGYAVEGDLAHCEDEGVRPEADAEAVSKKAKDRGRQQLGSLGSGNHFLEVQRVTDVYRADVAESFGLEDDQIVVLIHCGSRGLGHQICTDYLREIEQTHQGLLEQLPNKELAAAPAGSHLAEEYYAAMNAAINFAWVNRQLIMHRTREVFADVFDRDWRDMEMELLYDVAHNIAKKETHSVDRGDPENSGGAVESTERELFVHRKGATRAFPAGHPEVPAAYRDVGQPIIIPGSMGSGSYVLRGGQNSMEETFGSTAHGAGRLMSRTEAKDTYWGEDVQDELQDHQQIYVRAQSGATVAEEAPGVYKDVDGVVRISDELGIGDRVARTFPVCNIKG
ncbi:RNA-splicing ligase RtcB [Halorhabdus sp. CBA1104]|uniref:RtcB family protein n=1 Tax=Halorhabdus sp. CBA1104 TaxID=1380432 RepID=UPI0012B207D9|nr:RtcB family protein [Halorhabdus sp. CBA1104]QGN06883.1 RNA-splicing ligase RtcB [Halorhabdus sp. CBA1104]